MPVLQVRRQLGDLAVKLQRLRLPSPAASSRGSSWPRASGQAQALEFHGEVAELTPHLENGQKELAFTHQLTVPGGKAYPLSEVRFFNRHPPLVLVGRTFYLLRNPPPPQVLEHWARQPALPMRKLSHGC